jgi:DNA-binding transcriptional LysR family regulator
LDSGFDVAFQTRPVRDSLVRLRRVAQLPFVLCAAPGYLATSGTPATLGDLEAHDCLVHDNEPTWHFDSGGEKLSYKPRSSPFLTNSYLALHKATIHGRGISMLPRRLANDGFEQGSLTPLLADLHTPDRSLYAVHGPSARTPKKIEVLIDFLSGWFRTRTP